MRHAYSFSRGKHIDLASFNAYIVVAKEISSITKSCSFSRGELKPQITLFLK